ncbi:MAG: hypothetical protein NXI30_20525 [bacterium]|nr:hypothetical protein [bacterium]
MRLPLFSRRTLPIGAFALGLLVASDALAIQLLSRVANASIRSGNVTLTDDSVSGFAPGPVGSTGLVEANGANIVPEMPLIDSGAITDHDLPIGALGVSGGFDSISNGPGDNRIFDSGGGASVSWFDDLTVTSSTLPFGTPVDVRFVVDLAYTASAQSSLSLATASADCTSTAAGVQGIVPADNRYFDSLEFGIFIQNGLFLPPYQAEYTISTTVGAVFPFGFACDVSSFGEVFPTGPPNNRINNTASGWSALGVAIGAEVVGADAELVSGLIGGPFPAVSASGPAAAQAALPVNPYVVPEPAFGAGLSLGGLLLAATRRTRRQGVRVDG